MTTSIRHSATVQQTALPQHSRSEAVTESGATSLHNVHQGQRAADATEGMVRAVRSNGMSRAKAATAVSHLPTGPAIHADRAAMTPRSGLQRQPTLRGGTVPSSPADSTARAQTRGLLNELLTTLNGKTDDKTGKLLSDQLRFQKGSGGQVLMYKPAQERVAAESRDKYMQSRSGVEARELAGGKFLALLEGAGMTLDARDRSALPSASHEGDIGRLKALLQQAIKHMDAIDRNETLKKELNQNPLSDPTKGALFLRSNTDGAKFLGKALSGMFANDTRQIVASMNAAFENALQGAGPSPDRTAVDKALVITYQTLLQSLSDIKLPDDFQQIAHELGRMVDDAAATQSSNASAHTRELIAKNARTCKANIVPAMLLRSLCTALTMELNQSETAIFKQVTADKTNSNWGVKMQQMSALLISRINNAAYNKKETPITGAFPGLKDFVNSAQNNIDQFTAMRELVARL